MFTHIISFLLSHLYLKFFGCMLQGEFVVQYVGLAKRVGRGMVLSNGKEPWAHYKTVRGGRVGVWCVVLSRGRKHVVRKKT
jgi:hypothetical protein